MYQIANGMLSNLSYQLHQQKMEEKYDQINKKIPKVRKGLEYPPLVTPKSQIADAQAVFYVIPEKRYRISLQDSGVT
ncbi:MAG: hypothetical protein WCV43_03690 [Candidatus Caldatribacteriota bacterium]